MRRPLMGLVASKLKGMLTWDGSSGSPALLGIVDGAGCSARVSAEPVTRGTPLMAARTRAQSSAHRAIGPSLSSDQQRAMAPALDTRPNVGRRPVDPHVRDGEMIDPSVSVPMPNPMQPDAPAAAEPALEPDEPRSGFHGLLVRPPCQTSPMARAPSVVLATSTAPASLSLRTTAASRLGRRSLYGSAPQVVGMSAVSRRSLAPQGMPCSGPRYLPAAISASAASACLWARSSVMGMANLSLSSGRGNRCR